MSIIPNPDAMAAFAADLAKSCHAPCLIFLEGELGAGKTTLVRGFLRALGYRGPVKSPTYAMVETYELPQKIIHFDLYRLTDPMELEEMGLRDYFTEAAIIFVEWPERAGGILPNPDLRCYIEILPEGRKVEISTCAQH